MVKEYTERDVLRLGKRYNNKKRTYLLIDPIQAKHIPAIPSESLSMMTSLGKKVAMKYSEAKLVIGFAETATAIGVAVASCLDGDCMYIHTTREDTGIAANVIEFLEEHSHAAEQKLVFGYAAEYVEPVMKGMLAGLALACALVAVLEILNDSVNTEEDVERYLGLSVFAVVPDREVSRKMKKKRGRS